jgi:hypothetical protein
MRKSRVSLVKRTWFGRYFFLLAVVCWFAVPASASDIAHGAVAMHLLRPGIPGIGDLDGDDIPDLASGIRTGQTPEGYSYRVDLDFSANSEAKPFSVFSEDSTGLNIEAVDIDGDHDLDLLVSGRFSPQPIGIWLNDGRGRFTRGDLAKYVLRAWQTRPAVQSPSINASVILHFTRRLQMASRQRRPDFYTPHLFLGKVSFPSLNLFRISTGPARFRAPPIPGI